MPWVENLQEWRDRMKANDIECLQLHDCILAADGGRYVDRTIPPPEPQQERLRAQLYFQQQKLAVLEGAFKQMEHALDIQLQYYRIGAGPSPHEGDLMRLEVMKGHVEATRAKIVEIENDIMPSRFEGIAEARQQAKMQRLEKCDKMQEELRKYKI